MQPPAVTHVAKEDPPPRRRWRWGRPGTTFLGRPAGDAYANRWQAACGQGG